jgi:hypothetical protein
LQKKCLKLEELDLYGNKKITDLSLIAIANNCKNLKKLCVDKCTKITDNGLIEIALNCLKLKDLNCEYGDGIQNINLTFKNLNEITKSFKYHFKKYIL